MGWSIYGYNAVPYTQKDFLDTIKAPESHFGKFPEFKAAVKSGKLAAYTFLEPSWSLTGKSQYPNYDVALDEQLIHDLYYTLQSSPVWNETLLIITYDENGGNYDHVPPPQGAVPPDGAVCQSGFDFKRFGTRVPPVLASPLIEKGTVFRVPHGTTPIDHTAILKAVERRFGVQQRLLRLYRKTHQGLGEGQGGTGRGGQGLCETRRAQGSAASGRPRHGSGAGRHPATRRKARGSARSQPECGGRAAPRYAGDRHARGLSASGLSLRRRARPLFFAPHPRMIVPDSFRKRPFDRSSRLAGFGARARRGDGSACRRLRSQAGARRGARPVPLRPRAGRPCRFRGGAA